MKPARPHINNLSTSAKLKMGDMVAFTHYATPSPQEYREKESHGIVVEVGLSIIKIRPLADFSNIVLCNAADCRLIKAKENG